MLKSAQRKSFRDISTSAPRLEWLELYRSGKALQAQKLTVMLIVRGFAC